MAYSALERADAFIMAGELDDALAALDEHLAATPTDDDARRLRARVLMSIGLHLGVAAKYDASQLYLGRAITDYDAVNTLNTSDIAGKAALLIELDDFETARQVLLHGLNTFPDTDLLNDHLVTLLIQQGEYDEARTRLDALPPTWRWLCLSGDLAAHTWANDRAITDYSRALQAIDEQSHTQNNAAFWNNQRAYLLIRRAGIYWTVGQLAEADLDYAAALNFVPTDSVLIFQRSLLAVERDDLIEAVALCRDALMTSDAKLQSYIENTLHTNPRYHALAMLLLQGDADV